MIIRCHDEIDARHRTVVVRRYQFTPKTRCERVLIVLHSVLQVVSTLGFVNSRQETEKVRHFERSELLTGLLSFNDQYTVEKLYARRFQRHHLFDLNRLD